MMKDFTTEEYIKPVLGWFRAMYYPITDEVVLKALHCDLLLQRNNSRNAIAVRKDEVFYTSCPPANEVYDEIKRFAEVASTEDGELDDWAWQEEGLS